MPGVSPSVQLLLQPTAEESRATLQRMALSRLESEVHSRGNPHSQPGGRQLTTSIWLGCLVRARLKSRRMVLFVMKLADLIVRAG